MLKGQTLEAVYLIGEEHMLIQGRAIVVALETQHFQGQF